MHAAIDEVSQALATLGKGSPWNANTKVSDEFLTPLFEAYFRRLGLRNLLRKKSFYELADFVPEEEIDCEIRDKLDAIVAVAGKATPSAN